MKTYSKRSTIRQLVNRETVYNLSDYSRKVSKQVAPMTITEIVRALGHMAKEGQLYFRIEGKKVIGCLTSGPKAFALV